MVLVILFGLVYEVEYDEVWYCFQVRVWGYLVLLDYQIQICNWCKWMVIMYIEVFEVIGGCGIVGELIWVVLCYVCEQKFKVVFVCVYVEVFM